MNDYIVSMASTQSSLAQIEVLEFITRGRGDQLNFRYLTVGEVMARFGEESQQIIILLMEYGLIKRVGWKNRVKSFMFESQLSQMTQIRSSSLGLMRIEKFYKKRLTPEALPPLESKRLVQTSVTASLVMI